MIVNIVGEQDPLDNLAGDVMCLSSYPSNMRRLAMSIGLPVIISGGDVGVSGATLDSYSNQYKSSRSAFGFL